MLPLVTVKKVFQEMLPDSSNIPFLLFEKLLCLSCIAEFCRNKISFTK